MNVVEFEETPSIGYAVNHSEIFVKKSRPTVVLSLLIYTIERSV